LALYIVTEGKFLFFRQEGSEANTYPFTKTHHAARDTDTKLRNALGGFQQRTLFFLSGLSPRCRHGSWGKHILTFWGRFRRRGGHLCPQHI
jgi:hypothetical protein